MTDSSTRDRVRVGGDLERIKAKLSAVASLMHDVLDHFQPTPDWETFNARHEELRFLIDSLSLIEAHCEEVMQGINPVAVPRGEA